MYLSELVNSSALVLIALLSNAFDVNRYAVSGEANTACCAQARGALVSTVHTDAEIAASIRQQLRESRFLDYSAISVSVTGGRAVLTGEVATAAERSLATQCALRGGAQEVDNQLHVVAGAHRAMIARSSLCSGDAANAVAAIVPRRLAAARAS